MTSNEKFICLGKSCATPLVHWHGYCCCHAFVLRSIRIRFRPSANLSAVFLLVLFMLPASVLATQQWTPSATVYAYSLSRQAGQIAPSVNTIVGQEQPHRVAAGETLLDIAREYHLGYQELVQANPGVDPWVPSAGLEIKIPSAWILPDGPRRGLVLNIPEMRLYYYLSESKVMSFPLGIGMEGWQIPAGDYFIGEKRVDPVWHVPTSIQEEMETPIKVVPAGPDNPLGRYWMRLSMTSYGIHGTNNPWAVGRRVTHGCLRLYPEDIAFLFPRVAVKTPVKIVYQYTKVGMRDGNAYFQIYRFNGKTRDEDLFQEIVLRLRGLGLQADLRRLWRLLQEAPDGALLPVPASPTLVAVFDDGSRR